MAVWKCRKYIGRIFNHFIRNCNHGGIRWPWGPEIRLARSCQNSRQFSPPQSTCFLSFEHMTG